MVRVGLPWPDVGAPPRIPESWRDEQTECMMVIGHPGIGKTLTRDLLLAWSLYRYMNEGGRDLQKTLVVVVLVLGVGKGPSPLYGRGSNHRENRGGGLAVCFSLSP